MNKFALSTLCAISLLALEMQSALAENVAVVGDTVFILDNNPTSGGARIVARTLNADGTLTQNQCFVDPVSDSLNLGLDATISATDITIKNGAAIITTTSPSTETPGGVISRNVSSCLTADPVCLATVVDGVLTIPCVQYNGQVLEVEFQQRGSSMNWELKSSPILNDTFSGYKTNSSN